MADADEDAILARHSRVASTIDRDIDGSDSGSDSDTAPDYQFLATTTASNKHALPARGVKDFEPNPTVRQASNLDISRNAMTQALSVIRVHNFSRKQENTGVYFSDPAQWDGQLFEDVALAKIEDVEKRRKLRESSALQKGEGRCVAVQRFTSTFVRTMGKTDRRNWTWLLPEEALFLLERGGLDIRYEEAALAEHVSETGVTAGADEGIDLTGTEDLQTHLTIGQIPMSLQGAYAAFISKSGLTLERYQVYANLRRGGYVVQRSKTWHGPIQPDPDHNTLNQSSDSGTVTEITHPLSFIHQMFSWLFISSPKPSTVISHNCMTGPLIAPGLFRSYGDVYRSLHLIQQYDYTIPDHLSISHNNIHSDATIEHDPIELLSDPPLLPTFTINKPSCITTYKKSAPPPADYTVVVLDARTTNIPTSTQIGNLLASMPDDELKDAHRKRLETRIKYGKRNILLGVVDNGVISYLRFSSGGFGMGDWLWEENERKGRQRAGTKGRGGGRGNGRGRGRGRGRGGRGG